MLSLQTARLGVAVAILSFLLAFFIPVFPYKMATDCTPPPSGFYTCGATLTLGFFIGFNSLGLNLFHWVASWDSSFGSGTYVPPVITYAIDGGWSQLTASGIFVLVILPILAFLAASLIFPEEKMLLSRIGHSESERLETS